MYLNSRSHLQHLQGIGVTLGRHRLDEHHLLGVRHLHDDPGSGLHHRDVALKSPGRRPADLRLLGIVRRIPIRPALHPGTIDTLLTITDLHNDLFDHVLL